MKEKLAIFDLDGTLFDTNFVNYYSYKEALEYFDINTMIEYNEYKEWNGKSYKEFLPQLVNDKELIEKVHDKKVELYEKNLNKARANEHLFNIIEGIKDSYNIALVTTASRKNTLQIVEYFGKTKLFDLIITKEDVKKIKPNPEGFIKAMEYFKTDSKDTIIFEDSQVGISAARESRAVVFTVNKF